MGIHLRPTRKLLLAMGVGSVAAIGLAVLVWRAEGRQRAEWRARLAEKQQEASEVETAARMLPETERRLSDVRYRLSFLRSAEPSDFQPALLMEMSDLARRTGVTLTAFNPLDVAAAQQSPIEKAGYEKVAPHKFLPINMGVEGSFRDVTRFFYRLTGLPKIVSIDSVNIQPSATLGPDAVRATCQMTAYLVKEVDPQTSAAAARMKEIGEAEQQFKAKHESYATLSALRSENLISFDEGQELDGYTFITDPSTGKTGFKILATAKSPGLHNLSIDQSTKITDETDKVPYE